MVTKPVVTANRPEVKAEIKPLDELEPECKTINAWHRGEQIEPAVLNAATSSVDESLSVLARGLIGGDGWITDGLADEARGQVWEFMLKEGGGFDRYDGTRPLGPYIFSTLKWFCVGRDSAKNQLLRNGPVDEGRSSDACSTQRTRRRPLSLEFDPVDPNTTDREVRREELAEAVMDALNELPDDERELIIKQFWDGANLAEMARELGISANKLYCKSFRVREKLRRLLGDIDLLL
jgi:RNA polymerase sigma factor (sigma-70 family)